MDPIAQKLASYHWPYADQDLNAYEIIARKIAKVGKERDVITYSDLVRDVTFKIKTINEGKDYHINVKEWGPLDRALIGDFLGRLCVETYQRGGFMGSALAYSESQNAPGKGFFDFMKELGVLHGQDLQVFWKEEREKAYAWYASHDW